MEERFAKLEEDMRDVKSTLSRLEPMIIRIDSTLTSTLPHLATKVQLADLRGEVSKDISDLRSEVRTSISDLRGELRTGITDLRADVGKDVSSLRTEMHQALSHMPTKTYMWGVLSVLITAYGAGLAALAVLR